MKLFAGLLLSLVLAAPALADTPAGRRLEQAQLLRELLEKDTTTGDSRAEAMLRLGNLYMEHGFEQPEEAQKVEWLDKAVVLYDGILDDYRRFDGRAQASYRMGVALHASGHPEEAIDKFDLVVKEYGETKWVPKAHHELGEHYFDERNLYKAITSYRKARTYPEADTYAHSTYKLAWCYYNAKDYETAIGTMTGVFDVPETAGMTEGLQTDAMADLARFYADADRYDDGYAFFRDNGDTENLKVMLTRMAALYERNGNDAGLKRVKKTLEKEFGDSP